jgi:fructokinase
VERKSSDFAIPRSERLLMRIGIDLGGTKIEIIALDAAGRTLLRRRIPTPAGDYAATVAAIAALVESAERELGSRATVGVGTPGAVSRRTGLMKNSNSTALNGRPLHRDLAERLGRPIAIANDANCFALSESVDGAAAGAAVVFGVILGTGVGGGIAFERRVIAGSEGIAGEWGHNPLPWPRDDERPGPPCYCGKSGCIETFSSGPALARERETRAPREALDTYLDRLARGLAHVCNILDPDAIVIGGGVSNLPELYAELPGRMRPYVFSDGFQTPIRPALHGDSSGVRGAAWLNDADGPSAPPSPM